MRIAWWFGPGSVVAAADRIRPSNVQLWRIRVLLDAEKADRTEFATVPVTRLESDEPVLVARSRSPSGPRTPERGAIHSAAQDLEHGDLLVGK